MSNKEEPIESDGIVVQLFPAGQFAVDLGDRTILAHLSGKMRMNKIKILTGDKVNIEMSPYDLTKGRITFRYK